MASNYCTYIPSKGKNLFRELKKQFGYETARSVFLRAINPQFISDYKGTLSLDAEGIPTYESLINNSYMKSFIGDKRIIESLNKNYTAQEDTRENYGNLLGSAHLFNTTNPQRDKYIATVEYTEDGKINVVIQPKTTTAINKFKEQYGAYKLNDKLAEIFQPLGVTIGDLTQAEVNAGRVGVTDFSKVRGIANGFVSVIKVANNMEGATSLTEEFAHLLVGIFKDEPLVARALNTLINNEDALKEILGDDYEDTVTFHEGNMELIAEEALGHIMRKNLLNKADSIKTPTPSLFRRMLDWIIKQFKGFNHEDIQNTIDRVDGLMGTLAIDILMGTRKITQEDIKKAERETQFNALSERIDRNISILRGAAKTETKRYKITKDASKRTSAEILVNEILSYTADDANTVEGLFNYAKTALEELRSLDMQFQLVDTMNPQQKFGFLRSVRMYIQSYGSFIHALNKAILEEENEIDNMFLQDFELHGETVSIKDVLVELNYLSTQLTGRYNQTAMPAFAEFLKPFFGNEITVPFGKYAGTTMSVESLLAEAQSDISFMDRWLDSMADSADMLLQLFDAAVKKAKDNARLESLDDIKRIQNFRDKVEKLGITDFSWMFETDDEGHKSGNYISEVNYAQFHKELTEFEKSLEDKYGKNPTGEDAINKIADRKAWLSTHAVSVFGVPQPNPVVYKSNAYASLTTTQRDILEEFLSIKDKFDSKLPKDRVDRLKAVQIRKSGSQRLWESITSPSSLYDNIKESMSVSLFEKEDDDTIFGTAKGLTDFAGNEFMTLPVLYTTRLKNPDELTDDVIGSLMSYACMANQYEQLDKIVDPLEVGKTLVSEERKVRKTRGGKALVEKFSALDVDVTNKILTSRSNIEQKLNDFFESQIYGKYLKDEGTFDVLGKKVNINKATSLLLKGSSLAQLGFNWLANIANVATGIGMQNIEAAAGQFFGPKELLKADAAYAKELIPFMAEVGSRTKTNKLALFFELFDVKQDFGSKKNIQKKNLLQRVFGADIAFLGQQAGDHWLYGRTAIAMAMREKILFNGKQMSLWDALQVENIKDSSAIKQLNYRDIKTLNGEAFDVAAFSRKVAHVNQGCFGIYNDEDANAANRVAMGRLLQQYRKWMKVQYNKRFQNAQGNLATGTWEEGYYRTVGRLLNQWARGEIQLSTLKETLSEEEKANLRRAITELVQFWAVWSLANLIDWPDDKDRPWAIKLAEYSCRRLVHELGGLAPSTIMPQELLKTVRNPIPATSVVQNGFNLINSAIDPTDWFDETESGPYKGMSTLHKNLIKSPIPGVSQYRQVKKFTEDIDTSIGYYARPSAY